MSTISHDQLPYTAGQYLPRKVKTTRDAIRSLDPLTKRFVHALVFVGDIEIKEEGDTA